MKRIVLLAFFSIIVQKSYGVPVGGDIKVGGMLFGLLMLFVSGLFFINSVLQRILTTHKKYYGAIYFYSAFVLGSVLICKKNGLDGELSKIFLPVSVFVLIVCIINLLIGNRSIHSGSDKVQPKHEDEGDVI